MPTRHIVLVRVRPDATAEEVQRAFDDLAALKGKIPGLLSFHGGPNTSTEDSAKGYNYGFVMDFADAASRDGYVPHPLHQQAATRLRALREPGGIAVFDFDF